MANQSVSLCHESIGNPLAHGSSLMLVLAALCLSSACTSGGMVGSADTDTAATDAARSLKSKGSPPGGGGGSPTPTPTTSTDGTATYDASIGASVDANGFAELPLRSGARRFFVNSTSGSDNNGCTRAQQPGTPLKSIAVAMTCILDGNGDQVLVAQGTSYGEYLPNFTGRGGFSPLYPTVLQSYDPADALNEAKYGRALSPNRPVLRAAQANMVLGGGGTSPSFIAIRGLDINPGNVEGSSIPLFPNTNGTPNYVLLENNIFRHTALYPDLGSKNGVAPPGDHLIIRNNSIYGGWSGSGHAQGIYLAYWTNYTIEDNVLYHNGWKIGANRDDPMTAGGLVGDAVFRHSVYAQEDSSGTARRNLIMDGPADCGSYRGNIVYTENLAIDCPIGVGVGGGLFYDKQNPKGVDLQVSYNAFFGGEDLTSVDPRGIGMTSVNGKQGSSAHHNLFVRNKNPNGVNAYTFQTGAAFNLPSYMSYDQNVVYSWATNGQTFASTGTYPSQDLATFTNNIWDAPSSGTNTNNGNVKFPMPYTPAQFYAALGFADKQAFANYVIEHPEAHIQRQARALLFAGYGL